MQAYVQFAGTVKAHAAALPCHHFPLQRRERADDVGLMRGNYQLYVRVGIKNHVKQVGNAIHIHTVSPLVYQQHVAILGQS